MKILHIGHFSWFSTARTGASSLANYYSPDRKITNGLIRNGHIVWDFSYRDTARGLSPFMSSKKLGLGRMRKYLIEIAQQFSPDLILMGHCEIIGSKTMAQLRSALPNVKIAQRWGDPFTDKAILHLREKQPYLDAFFTVASPASYAPHLKISGNDSPPLYHMPNIIDRSAEIGQGFAATDYDFDVFFAGNETAYRRRIVSEISNMPDVRFGLYGMGNPQLGGALLGRTIAASKIGLCLGRADVPDPMIISDRLVHLIGNGALTIIAPRVPELINIFSEDEVVYCDSEELPEVILRYLKDDVARRRIAKNGWQSAREKYNEQRVTKFMVEAAMGESFSEKYEWLYASVLPTAQKP